MGQPYFGPAHPLLCPTGLLQGWGWVSEPSWLALLTPDSGICRQLASEQQGILSDGKAAAATVLSDSHSLCVGHATFCVQLTCAAAVLWGLLSCRRKCSLGFSFISFLFLATNKREIFGVWIAWLKDSGWLKAGDLQRHPEIIVFNKTGTLSENRMTCLKRRRQVPVGL